MRFPVYSTNYNIFPMRKLSPREVEGSFYVTVSNSQKADGREPQMDRLQGWLYLLQTFLLFQRGSGHLKELLFMSHTAAQGLCVVLIFFQLNRSLCLLRTEGRSVGS